MSAETDNAYFCTVEEREGYLYYFEVIRRKYIVGSISVSNSSGTMITFNSFGTNYSAVFLSSGNFLGEK